MNVFYCFQSADEVSHFFRAVQIAQGTVIGRRQAGRYREEFLPEEAIDTSAIRVGKSFDYLPGQIGLDKKL
jgi:hypothetical protein